MSKSTPPSPPPPATPPPAAGPPPEPERFPTYDPARDSAAPSFTVVNREELLALARRLPPPTLEMINREDRDREEAAKRRAVLDSLREGEREVYFVHCYAGNPGSKYGDGCGFASLDVGGISFAEAHAPLGVNDQGDLEQSPRKVGQFMELTQNEVEYALFRIGFSVVRRAPSGNRMLSIDDPRYCFAPGDESLGTFLRLIKRADLAQHQQDEIAQTTVIPWKDSTYMPAPRSIPCVLVAFPYCVQNAQKLSAGRTARTREWLDEERARWRKSWGLPEEATAAPATAGAT